jgi:hypothetical protein
VALGKSFTLILLILSGFGADTDAFFLVDKRATPWPPLLPRLTPEKYRLLRSFRSFACMVPVVLVVATVLLSVVPRPSVISSSPVSSLKTPLSPCPSRLSLSLFCLCPENPTSGFVLLDPTLGWYFLVSNRSLSSSSTFQELSELKVAWGGR